MSACCQNPVFIFGKKISDKPEPVVSPERMAEAKRQFAALNSDPEAIDRMLERLKNK